MINMTEFAVLMGTVTVFTLLVLFVASLVMLFDKGDE